MKKLVKFLGIVLGLVVLLVVGLAAYLKFFFDPNDFKDQISAQVKKATGRDLLIKDDLSLSYYPWFGIKTGSVELGNAPGFGDQPFAKVDGVDVKVELWPLFSKQIVTDTISVDGLRVNLVRNKQGKTNWEDLAKGAADKPAEKPSEEPAEQAKEQGEGFSLEALKINGVKLSNAHLSWVDQQSGSATSVEKLNLTTGAISTTQPVSVDLAFDLAAKGQGRKHFALEGQIKLDLPKETVTLSDLKLNLAGLPLHGGFTVSKLQSKPQVSGQLTSSSFSPRDVFKQLGMAAPATQDPKVLGRAKLQASLQASADGLNLSKLKLELDDSTLQGSFSVSNFAKPALRMDLQVDSFDLDRYLPPPAAGQPKAAAAPAKGGEPPLAALRDLNLNGSFKIGKLKAYNLRSQQVSITVKAKNGNIRVHPASAQLYEGRYQGDINVNVRGKKPVLSMNESLKGVQAAPLFKDLAQWTWIEGKADLSAKLNATGLAPDELRSSLSGDVAFAFQDGKIHGLNAAQDLCKLYAVLKQRPVQGTTSDDMEFASFQGQADIKNGVLQTQQLNLKSAFIELKGGGTADLNKQTLNFPLEAFVGEKFECGGSKNIAELKGHGLPFKVYNTFSDVKVKVDFSGLLKARIEAEKEKFKQKAEEKLKEKLEEKLGEKLKDKVGDEVKEKLEDKVKDEALRRLFGK